MRKKILYFIFAFVLHQTILVAAAENVPNTYSGQWVKKEPTSISLHITLTENNTSIFDNDDDTQNIASLNPQTVNAIAKLGDHYLIQTWIGTKWIHPQKAIIGDVIQVSENIALLERINLHTLPFDTESNNLSLAPQMVQSFEKYIDGQNKSWNHIHTWVGDMWLLAPIAPASTTFFVSTTGNDTNPGTINEPFRTLTRARDAIRQLKVNKPNGLGPIIVYVRGGIYELSSSFSLNEQDSGESAIAPVTYCSYPGETARLIGGKKLDEKMASIVTNSDILSRIPDSAKGKVYQIDLKSQGITDYGSISTFGMGIGTSFSYPELFINGNATTLARYPKQGYLLTRNVVNAGGFTPDQGVAFTYDDDRISKYALADDVWMQGYWKFDWADQTLKVSSIDSNKKTIQTVQSHIFGIDSQKRYYFFNLLEELSAENEWFLDRKTGILYFIPPQNKIPSEMIFSTLKDPLITLDKTNNVKILNFHLEASRGQSFSITNGNDNLVSGVTIKNMGGLGASIIGGTNNGIIGSEIYDAGKGGIVLSGGDRNTLSSGGQYAINNQIYRYSRLNKTYAGAITLYGVGNKAAHNIIHDAPHVAILFGGNENVIEYNEIYDVIKETNDTGAIYAGRDWTVRGNKIQYNYFHDLKGTPGQRAIGVYLDDALSGNFVTSNVFSNVQTAVFVHGGRDNTISNNVIANSKDSIVIITADPSYDWFDPKDGLLYAELKGVPYTNEFWSINYPQLLTVTQDEPKLPKYNIVTNNLVVNSPDIQLSAEALRSATFKNNYITKTNPGFVNMDRNNFQLTPNAEVFQKIKSFKNIPFDQIGLHE